jgi:hypothetical protein
MSIAKFQTVQGVTVEGQPTDVQVLATASPDSLTGGIGGLGAIYNPANTYPKGSIVVVTESMAATLGVQSGVYGCTKVVPPNKYPNFPEKLQSTRYWDFLFYLLRQVSTCQAGVIVIQSSAPF